MADDIQAHAGESNIVSSEGNYDLRAMQELSIEDSDSDTEQDNPVEAESQTDTQDVDPNDGEDREYDNDSDDDNSDFRTEDNKVQQEQPKEKVTLKDGDKDVSISKDAKIEVKIDGKKEMMTLQEVINNASGSVHVSRETARLGREKKEFSTRKEAFDKETAQVNANAAALLEIKDPYELCEYICDLKGGDPDALFNDMVKNTVEALNRYKDMTDRELEQERELRKLRRDAKTREVSERVSNEAKSRTEKITNLNSTLEKEGFKLDDFQNTISEMQEAINNGEELGFGLDTIEKPTENDIIDYMIAKQLDNRVMDAISKVNTALADDHEFITKTKKSILKTESLYGKMSEAEVATFIKEAFKVSNKALSENLSKKVNQTKSKTVYSKEQEEDDEGPDTLEELRESFRRNI